MSHAYVGWELPEAVRDLLLVLFPPVYPDVVAHHVTLAFGVPLDTPLPTATKGIVVGIADNGEGVQALVVEIDGEIKRPDGKIYHITWSLDREKGFKPQHSNDVIREEGFKETPRVPIVLVPKLFPND